MAGWLGLDPHPFTLRELFWMRQAQIENEESGQKLRIKEMALLLAEVRNAGYSAAAPHCRTRPRPARPGDFLPDEMKPPPRKLSEALAPAMMRGGAVQISRERIAQK